MVARVVSGKSIRGILVYNERKIENAEASVLMAAGFPRSPEELSFKNKLERFEILTRQNERTKTNALHISLNFSNRDELDDEKLRQIAMDYMDGIGFGNQPFLVYRHYDASHPHIHIATVNIAEGGERIETHNIGKYRSEKIRKSIEERYDLVKAEEQKKEMAYMLKPIDLERIVYGKQETKSAISRTVREVADSYKFTSFSEFQTVLNQFNVIANRGNPGSNLYKKGGLTYHLLGGYGEKVGVPIKASSIYSSPTLKNLEKKYSRHKMQRKPYGQRLKHLIDKAMKNENDIRGLQRELVEQGIRIFLYGNEAGDIYGVTYIDNATRTVYKGSDLGKGYGAGAFLKRTGISLDDLRDMDLREEETEPATSLQTLPVIQVVLSDNTIGHGEKSDRGYSKKLQKTRIHQLE
ncbi:relaxase/mobilization nuclease domain-containing protein [Sphingobacterium phlebotomi]|uniref:Relaxase/mobilization nuclease domain-containing protein n=1 Tax=Sphingobacterium phlebotomi TaxID=2605433 RepID=A0A5D4H9A6_9SPHI|nr:relaxase/mobilization nuclease domain-containing protein [Sphingobacterium phlebotomi]TYR37456.1 relaxase/mobilization nuclease domain-containing protein [Sphingobacterium phlebotomi]